MPNWCDNKIIIEGDTETLIKIAETMFSEGYEQVDGELSGQPMRLRPMPNILQGTMSPAPTGEFDPDGRIFGFVNDPDNRYWDQEAYDQAKVAHENGVVKAQQAFAETGFYDWYEWAIANWGTKWSMNVRSCVGTDDYILVDGDTAWGPPLELLRFVSEQYPVMVSITYYEPGMDFIGAAVMRDGQIWNSEGSAYTHLPTMDEDDDRYWEVADDICSSLRLDHLERSLDLSGV